MALFSVVLLGASPSSVATTSSPLPYSFRRTSNLGTYPIQSSKRRVAAASSVRCEQQSAKQGGGGGAGVWLGRAAMMGFASAIAVEVSTGKGFLENLGVGTPAPTLALAVSGLVVGLAVFFLLQSGSAQD